MISWQNISWLFKSVAKITLQLFKQCKCPFWSCVNIPSGLWKLITSILAHSKLCKELSFLPWGTNSLTWTDDFSFFHYHFDVVSPSWLLVIGCLFFIPNSSIKSIISYTCHVLVSHKFGVLTCCKTCQLVVVKKNSQNLSY